MAGRVNRAANVGENLRYRARPQPIAAALHSTVAHSVGCCGTYLSENGTTEHAGLEHSLIIQERTGHGTERYHGLLGAKQTGRHSVSAGFISSGRSDSASWDSASGSSSARCDSAVSGRAKARRPDPHRTSDRCQFCSVGRMEGRAWSHGGDAVFAASLSFKAELHRHMAGLWVAC